MATTAMRFIGGPLHGDLVALQHGVRNYSVPIYRQPTTATYTARTMSPFQEFTYEQKMMKAAGNYFTVMAPVGWSDDAVHRALADFIEGVPRNFKDY